MTQEAIVTRRMPDGMAEVVVTRGTACGSNCGNCESCIFQSELKTPANNLIDAQPGQRVIIQSKSSKIFGAALLVYILPIVMILLGYFIAYSAGARRASAFRRAIGLLLGAVIIVISQRIKKTQNITFDIIQFNNEE